MPAMITDPKKRMAGHPPAVRCADAMIRCWWNWALLPMQLTAKAWRIRW